MLMPKLIIISAPSGTGKSTLINKLSMQAPELDLHFSISATSRKPRGKEQDGTEYYFLSEEDFLTRIERGDFLEFEQVYSGTYYGTLKSEVNRILAEGHNVIFDIDTVGALNIKKQYGDRALTIFVRPPSIEALRLRLEGRSTDSPEVIEERLEKAISELEKAPLFDVLLTNEDISNCANNLERVVRQFLQTPYSL